MLGMLTRSRAIIVFAVAAGAALPAAGSAQHLPARAEAKAFTRGFAGQPRRHNDVITAILVSDNDPRWALVRYTARPGADVGDDEAVRPKFKVHSEFERRSGAGATVGRPPAREHDELRRPFTMFVTYDVRHGRETYDASFSGTDECGSYGATFHEDAALRWHLVYEISDYGRPIQQTNTDGRESAGTYTARIVPNRSSVDITDVLAWSGVHNTACHDFGADRSCTQHLTLPADPGSGLVAIGERSVSVTGPDATALQATPCDGDSWLGSRWKLENDASAALDVLGGRPFTAAPVAHGRQV